MTNTYNLLDEPWIPVLTTDGKHTNTGLLDLFDNPTGYAMLDIADPLERYALTRMLLSIMYRVHQGGLTPEQALALYGKGNDPTIIDYLESMRARFDLKDETRPFLQTPGMRPASRNPDRSIALLHPNMKTELWTPRCTHDGITPAEAARLMLVSRSYDSAGVHTGMVGDPNMSDAKSTAIGVAVAGQHMLCMMTGHDLWETLLMNTPTVTVTGVDKPMWELDVEHVGRMDVPPTGPALTYTWPSRRILLLWDADGMCDGVWQTNGDRTPWDPKSPHHGTANVRELEPGAFLRTFKKTDPTPHAAHVLRDNKSNKIHDNYARPMWASWNTLMGELRPRVIDHALRMRDHATMDTLDIEWGQQSSKVAGVRFDTITLDRTRVDAERVAQLDAYASDIMKHLPVSRVEDDAHAMRLYAEPDAHIREWLDGETEEL